MKEIIGLSSPLEDERVKLKIEIKTLSLKHLTFGEHDTLLHFYNGERGYMLPPATKEKNDEVRAMVEKVKDAMQRELKYQMEG